MSAAEAIFMERAELQVTQELHKYNFLIYTHFLKIQ